MDEVRHEIRRIRQERGLSQRGLANVSGVDRPALNQIEGGHRSPTIETLGKLADALGVEVADFFPRAQPDLFAAAAGDASDVAALRASGAQQAPPIPLLLSAMWRANDAERRRTLEAASEAEVERYLRDIDQQLDWAERTLRGSEGRGHGNQRGLRRYMGHLSMLREEVDPDDAPPPSPEEMRELAGHAGVVADSV